MDTDRLVASITAGVERLQQDLSATAVEKMARLLTDLEHWNLHINLTAISDPEAMISRHLLDSLAVRPMLAGRRVLDVGTGAGFPGLALAIAEPELEFLLVDSNGRKISFVRHVIGALGLLNATAVKARAEDYAPAERFDTVIGPGARLHTQIAGACRPSAQKGRYIAGAQGKTSDRGAGAYQGHTWLEVRSDRRDRTGTRIACPACRLPAQKQRGMTHIIAIANRKGT